MEIKGIGGEARLLWISTSSLDAGVATTGRMMSELPRILYGEKFRVLHIINAAGTEETLNPKPCLNLCNAPILKPAGLRHPPNRGAGPLQGLQSGV